jgi:hypothetical protein
MPSTTTTTTASKLATELNDTTKLADDITRQANAKPGATRQVGNAKRAAHKEQEQLKAADADVKVEALLLHGELVEAWKTFHDGLANLSKLIDEAKEKEIHRYIENPETPGVMYENWQTYIMAVASRDLRQDAKLSAKDRNDLIEMLIRAGVSIRGASKAAGTVPSVGKKVADGEKPGEPKPAQPQGGSKPSGGRKPGEPDKNTPIAQAINAIDRAVRAAQRSPEASGFDARITVAAIENLIGTMAKAQRDLKKVVAERENTRPRSGNQGTNPRKGIAA